MNFNKDLEWADILKDLTPKGKQSIRSRFMKGNLPKDHVARAEWIKYFSCQPTTLECLKQALWYYRTKFANASMIANKAKSLVRFMKWYFLEDSKEYKLALRLVKRLTFIANRAENIPEEPIYPKRGRPQKKMQFPEIKENNLLKIKE